MADWPQILIPSQYRDSSGLWRPSNVPIRPDSVEVPPELRVRPAFLIMCSLPSFQDECRPYLSMAELGLPKTRTNDLVEMVCPLPFEPSMRIIASIHRDLRKHGSTTDGQLLLLRKWIGEGNALSAIVEKALREVPERVVFSEPQLFALQRLLVLHADDSEGEGLTEAQAAMLIRALFTVPDAILDEALGDAAGVDGSDPEDEIWIRLFIGNGGLVGFDGPMPELSRGYRLFAELARSERARSHHDFCPLDEWLVDEYGLNYVEMQALGIGLWTGSQMYADEGEHPMLVERGCYDSTPLRDRATRGFDAFVASREWYKGAFTRHRDTARRAALFHTPFLERPGLLQRDGRIATVAPRAVEGWLGVKGAYYRLLGLARQRGPQSLQRFQRFFGKLLEWYAVEVAEAAYPSQPTTLHYAGRVMPEQTYRVGRQEKKTCDVAIDLGLDLVLIEVTASRFTEKSLVDADAEKVRTDIAKMVTDKLRQLDRVITDLQSEKAQLPDVDIRLVQRIWPVVVTGDFVWQNPALHAHIRSGIRGLFAQPLTHSLIGRVPDGILVG